MANKMDFTRTIHLLSYDGMPEPSLSQIQKRARDCWSSLSNAQHLQLLRDVRDARIWYAGWIAAGGTPVFDQP